MIPEYQNFIILLGQIGWAASGVVLILKLPRVIKDWIVAKADRERQICEVLKQLSPNGGSSLADKIQSIGDKLDKHIAESEQDSLKLAEHIKQNHSKSN
jgi:hypothetical protein